MSEFDRATYELAGFVTAALDDVKHRRVTVKAALRMMHQAVAEREAKRPAPVRVAA